MRNKTRPQKHLPHNPPFFPGSTSLPIFSISSPRAAQGDGEWMLRSAHHALSLLLIPSRGEGSSHSAPAPGWSLSHGRQFSMNCSNMSPSHGLQSSPRCSSVGPPRGHKSCQQTCSSMGSSSWDHRSWQDPAPARAPYGVTASFGHPPALAWGLPRAAGGYLLHCGHPWSAGAQPASPWSSSRSAGKSLLWHLEHLLLLLLH